MTENMIELSEKSKFALEEAKEGLFYPVHEESIDFNFLLYNLAFKGPTPKPEFYKNFACVYSKKVNKHPVEILQELKHAYFLSAIHDSGNFEKYFPHINRNDYLQWIDKQIKMIDKARFL